MMITLDFGFYWIHRFFHIPFFYKNFHKQHHRHSVAVSIITIDNNSFDYLTSVTLPFLSGQLLLGRVHVFTMLMWHAYATLLGILGHCGYNFPWHPLSVFPGGLSLDFHDHHHSHNIGNYGFFFSFWDYICSTSVNYWKVVSEREKNE